MVRLVSAATLSLSVAAMEPNSEGVGVARRVGVAATSSEVLSRSDFAVNMTCGSCEKAVREVLQKMKENDQGVVSFSIDLPNKRVIVDATCSSDILKVSSSSFRLLYNAGTYISCC